MAESINSTPTPEIEPDDIVWLRDLDGTGSMHPCTPHCPGAIPYYRDQGRAEPMAAVRTAYGLLWHMRIDTRDPNLKLASDARKSLLWILDKGDQADGIARAKAMDGCFTGAA
jgi:hypothetical protein